MKLSAYLLCRWRGRARGRHWHSNRLERAVRELVQAAAAAVQRVAVVAVELVKHNAQQVVREACAWMRGLFLPYSLICEISEEPAIVQVISCALVAPCGSLTWELLFVDLGCACVALERRVKQHVLQLGIAPLCLYVTAGIACCVVAVKHLHGCEARAEGWGQAVWRRQICPCRPTMESSARWHLAQEKTRRLLQFLSLSFAP